MKKPLKITGVVLISILAVTALAIGGYKVMKQIEHNEMMKIVKSEKANKEYKELLKNLDGEAFSENGIIQSYKVVDSLTERNPMGGIFVTLYINNDKELNVTYSLNKDSSTGEYLPGSSSISEKLSKLLKGKRKND
ncbi:DUF1310 family protein [Streptococcus intermedius]|uniref:DUF1310 family protein n=1 Tax=Streptococcus intermedius TaxID=1338 RepID=UPI000E3C3BB3|nr:DUF1310 family protein [Streptococcus intermedius]